MHDELKFLHVLDRARCIVPPASGMNRSWFGVQEESPGRNPTLRGVPRSRVAPFWLAVSRGPWRGPISRWYWGATPSPMRLRVHWPRVPAGLPCGRWRAAGSTLRCGACRTSPSSPPISRISARRRWSSPTPCHRASRSGRRRVHAAHCGGLRHRRVGGARRHDDRHIVVFAVRGRQRLGGIPQCGVSRHPVERRHWASRARSRSTTRCAMPTTIATTRWRASTCCPRTSSPAASKLEPRVARTGAAAGCRQSIASACACSRVARNSTCGQRSCISCRLTRVGAR